MSLFGSLYTAVSGLGAQSAAFANISDNVANSQTTGFKETDTSFLDYLTTSTATENESGSVITRPDYTNDVQGTVTASTNTTALAIAGHGFFAVQEAVGAPVNGTAQLGAQQYYTRDGNFALDQNGYLVNDAGGYLQGWSVDSPPPASPTRPGCRRSKSAHRNLIQCPPARSPCRPTCRQRPPPPAPRQARCRCTMRWAPCMT